MKLPNHKINIFSNDFQRSMNHEETMKSRNELLLKNFTQSLEKNIRIDSQSYALLFKNENEIKEIFREIKDKISK